MYNKKPYYNKKQYNKTPRTFTRKDPDEQFAFECQKAWESAMEMRIYMDKIPYSMTTVQNDGQNKKCIYYIKDYNQLINQLREECVDQQEITYNIYRWFLFRTSKIDKTLMNLSGFQFKFNKESKIMQLQFMGRLYDCHYTKNPMNLIDPLKGRPTYEKIEELINKLYEEQSKSSRYSTGNKMFVVYQSDSPDIQVNQLRMEFESKFEMYRRMFSNAGKIKEFRTPTNAYCTVLVVYMDSNNKIHTYIPGIDFDDSDPETL